MITKRAILVLYIIGILPAFALASGEVSLPEEVQGCVSCHINPGMEMSFRNEDGRLRNLHITPEGFVHSIHFRNGHESCYDCHEGDFSQFPHQITAELPQCLDCHDEIRDEYVAIDEMTRTSVHFGETLAGFDCATCHSPHEMLPAREMTLEQKNIACLQCHEGNTPDDPLPISTRHDWHPQAALHLDRITCISCHTEPSGDDFSFRHRILPAENAVKDCYSCHSSDNRMVHYMGSFGDETPSELNRIELVHNYYISGSTRYHWLDWGGLGLMTLVFAGTAGHGALRIYFRRRNKK